jgi:hypothetical protein
LTGKWASGMPMPSTIVEIVNMVGMWGWKGLSAS